ncbi:MAG: aldo/keto reductase [Chloroflexi bacterium]|nr:aldo/keto reductase [Chloroflexota bacterium]
MRQRPFGKLGTASALTLGGGGIAGIWGETTREECVVTVREAVDSGIDVLDLAPSYGNGEAENVIGEAFNGALPGGIRVTTKCRVGDTPPDEVYDHLSTSLNGSLERMRLDHVDIMFVHNAVTLDTEGHERLTPASVVAEAIAPAFERLIAEGRIRHWGLTGIGEPDALIELLNNGPRPDYVQCIANLLDSPGGLLRGGIAARPRDIIAAANANGTAVMGIRAVQAGALTDAIDRPLPEGHSELADYARAAPFRAIAAEVGGSAAWLAHCYSLSMDGIGTVVLGVKNREELRECIDAESAAPLDAALIARIDNAVGRTDLT